MTCLHLPTRLLSFFSTSNEHLWRVVHRACFRQNTHICSQTLKVLMPREQLEKRFACHTISVLRPMAFRLKTLVRTTSHTYATVLNHQSNQRFESTCMVPGPDRTNVQNKGLRAYFPICTCHKSLVPCTCEAHKELGPTRSLLCAPAAIHDAILMFPLLDL